LLAATPKNAKAVVTARSAAIRAPLEEFNGVAPDETFWSRVFQRHDDHVHTYDMFIVDDAWQFKILHRPVTRSEQIYNTTRCITGDGGVVSGHGILRMYNCGGGSVS